MTQIMKDIDNEKYKYLNKLSYDRTLWTAAK